MRSSSLKTLAALLKTLAAYVDEYNIATLQEVGSIHMFVLIRKHVNAQPVSFRCTMLSLATPHFVQLVHQTRKRFHDTTVQVSVVFSRHEPLLFEKQTNTYLRIA